MRNLIRFIILLMPALVSAQGFPGVDPQKMQEMMEKAKEMQQCMGKVDQVKIQAFKQRGKQMSAKIKALCAAGKREEAVTEALSYSKELASDSTMSDVKKCGKIMEEFMPDLSTVEQTYEQDSSTGHICDK